VLSSDKDFAADYHTGLDAVPKQFRNPGIKKLLDAEFKQLEVDRKKYRDVHMQIEAHNPKDYIMDNSKQLPVNVFRIIDDVVYNYQSMVDELPAKDRILDPKYAIEMVKETCDDLAYVFMNKLQRKLRRRIPDHLRASTEMLVINLRSYLCTSYLFKKDVINHLLDIILQRVVLTFKKSLAEYGSAVGILAAQCVSEPMTQFVLDSKHRAGGSGGTKTNAIVRMQEVLGAKPTENMKNPSMKIMVKPEYENDRLKVQ